MGFAERMRALAQAVDGATRSRVEFVAEVRNETERLMQDAQATMRRINQEHKQRTKQLEADLGESRRHRRETARMLKANFHQQLAHMRQHLDEVLCAARKNREEAVSTMMSTFQTARRELVADLEEAARLWHARQRG